MPYPTFAEEIRSENREHPVASIVLGDLRIEGDVHDRDAVRKRILRDLSGKEFLYENELIDNVNELGIRADFQRRGYFQVTVNADAQPFDMRDRKERYLVIAQVKEGERFRLWDIDIINADPDRGLTFTSEKLRQLIHLQSGDVFNVDEIRHGFERLSRFYGSFGYMDFTAEPNFEFDNVPHRITMVLKLTEQNPYHIERIDVTGLDPDLEKALRAKIQIQDLYNDKALNDFYARYKTALSRYWNPTHSVTVVRNIAQSTVSLNFNFVTCTPPIN